MEISELRKGNYIDFKSTPGKYEEVEDINTYAVKYPSVNRVDFNDILPIPFTEKWFEKTKLRGEYYFNLVSYYEINEDAEFFVHNNEIYLNISEFEIKINYVHEAQNWYYLITGKELFE